MRPGATRLGLLAAALAVSSIAVLHAQPAADNVQQKSKPQVVTFELLPSRHMLIRTKVNDKGPFNLIFDTGAPINLVSSALAKQAGLKAGGFNLFSGPKTVSVKSMLVGGVEAADLPVLVMDHPTVETISLAFEDEYGPIEGIIGFPFFARYATTVDYQRKELTLAANGFKPGDYLGDVIVRINKLGNEGDRPRVVAPTAIWGMSVAKPAGDEPGGVAIETVTPGGPAATAGVQAGDRLLTLDGRWTDTVADTHQAVALVRPGRGVELVLLRGGVKVTVKVTPRQGL